MLLDVLSGLDELKVAVAYEDEHGRPVAELPGHLADLERCRPVYETLPGWTDDLTGGPVVVRPARRRRGITSSSSAEQIGVPVSIVSVGPDRRQTITATSADPDRASSGRIDADAHRSPRKGWRGSRRLGLRPEQLPRHVAIIMDGNGRWAQSRGLPRIVGHRRGIQSVRAVVEEGCRLGLDQLTLYCLSVENWKRPPRELKFLMRLLRHFLVVERDELMEQNVRLTMIGRREGLPADVLARARPDGRA